MGPLNPDYSCTIQLSLVLQWRRGIRLGPLNMEEHALPYARAVAASETYTPTSAPIQYATVRAYAGASR